MVSIQIIQEKETKDKYYILNFDGEIEYIGKFIDFDDADNHLHENKRIATWIFSSEAYKDLLKSQVHTNKHSQASQDVLKIYPVR